MHVNYRSLASFGVKAIWPKVRVLESMSNFKVKVYITVRKVSQGLQIMFSIKALAIYTNWEAMSKVKSFLNAHVHLGHKEYDI